MKMKLTNWNLYYFILTYIMYLLGVGMSRYYGGDISIVKSLIGGFWVLCILGSEKLMENLFRSQFYEEERIFTDKDQIARQAKIVLLTFFLVSSAIAIIGMQLESSYSITIISVFISTYLLLASLYLKPFALRKKGYYEIGMSIFQIGLVPVLGLFTTTTIKFHHALFLFCFPLFLIAIAHHLVIGLFTYAQDIKQKKHSLIIKITWQNGILIHTIALMISYLWIFSSLLIGIPAKLIVPSLFIFPIALFQAIWVIGIGQGKKPQWPLITTISGATLISTAYLMAYSLWVN